jgi:hypothetical protein
MVAPPASVRRALPLLGLLSILLLGGASPDVPDASLARLILEVDTLELYGAGLELGVVVTQEGEGVLYRRGGEDPRAAASAIKSAIALDLLVVLGDRLEEVPVGVEFLLSPGNHPAFRGFTKEQLANCRDMLPGRSYLDLARVMMGRTPAPSDVYNAACNLLMVKLGGPVAITRRLHELDPLFRGIDINRYMENWNGDGDNRATPESLVALYSMTSHGFVPGLDPDRVETLRDLMLEAGDGGPGSVYEKTGTLFPVPMVRVHAGYVERPGRNLVYAVMGEIPVPGGGDPGDLFVEFMSAIDSVAVLCRACEAPRRH